MKKKKWLLASLVIMCFPTLVCGQADWQYAQQTISHVQDLKNFWTNRTNELIPAIKQRMARDFPEQYTKLTQSNADDDTFLTEYNNLFVIKEYNLFKEDCENKIKEKGKITGRKTLKTPYNDGYSFKLENSDADCSDETRCLIPSNYEPYKMRVQENKIICEMADKVTNVSVYMKLRIEQNYDQLIFDQNISTTTYDNWLELKQKRHDPATDWDEGIKDDVGHVITRFRQGYRNYSE